MPTSGKKSLKSQKNSKNLSKKELKAVKNEPNNGKTFLIYYFEY